MNRLFRTGLCLLAFAGLANSNLPAASNANANLAKQFKVEWSTLRYQKSVSMKNPAVHENQSGPAERNESLTLSCQIHVLKPDRILGICSTPTVSALAPNEVTIKNNASRSRFQSRYEPLRYKPRFDRPESPSKIRTTMRSLLHLPQEPPPRPELVMTLEPSTIQIELGTAVLGPSVQEIAAVEGTFHVLEAESIAEIEIPFEPNENWIPVIDDLEILIKEAQSTPSSYRYRIDTRSPNSQGRRMSRRDIQVGSVLPERILIGQEFISEEGEPVHRSRSHSLPVHVGGSGSGSGGKGPVTRIRYRIGVNPQHREIPFRLKSIPLPKP